MSPELELLLCCARTHGDERTGARIRDLTASSLDWARLLELAGKHAVRPLVYQMLRAHCWESVPPSIQQELYEQVQAVTHHNLRLTAELARLAGLMESRGIKPIAFKGPTMAETLYGSVGLRESGDLDLLVRDSDIRGTKELMLAEGYELPVHLTPPEEARFIRQNCEFEFRRSGLLVEVHWRLAPAFLAFPLDIRTRAIPLEMAGRTMRIPATEDQLVFLCFHGAKHLWFSLKWICDVAELLHRYPDLDWNFVWENARRVGASRMLLLGLKLAHDFLDAPVPERRLKPDRVVDQVAAQVIRALENPMPANTTGLYYSWTVIRLRERPRDRLTYFLLAITPTPGDWAQFQLPRPLWFLYYLARPWRIFRKYGPIAPRTHPRLAVNGKACARFDSAGEDTHRMR